MSPRFSCVTAGVRELPLSLFASLFACGVPVDDYASGGRFGGLCHFR